jgi:hypothetical protein
MGLDQFAYITKVKPSKEVDFTVEVSEDNEEIHYWRKHPDIHGFMESLYRKKGGVDEFNCKPVVLVQEDIDNLANSILDGKLPSTVGFFFGSSAGDDEEENDDLEFCKKASEAIKKGYTVYYDSWW